VAHRDDRRGAGGSPPVGSTPLLPRSGFVQTGGQYTLKRWKVTQTTGDGGVVEVELRPDNPSFKPKKFSAKDGDLRVVAEFLEVVG